MRAVSGVYTWNNYYTWVWHRCDRAAAFFFFFCSFLRDCFAHNNGAVCTNQYIAAVCATYYLLRALKRLHNNNNNRIIHIISNACIGTITIRLQSRRPAASDGHYKIYYAVIIARLRRRSNGENWREKIKIVWYFVHVWYI